MTAAANMGLNVDVPALRPQKGEIADGGFAARQDHHIGVAGYGLARPHEHQFNAGLQPQGIQIIKIGDAGEHRHRDHA